MAKIYGTSRVWEEISAKLETVQLKANHPGEISALLDDCAWKYEQQLGQAMESLEDEIVLLEQDVNKEKERVENELAATREKSSLDIEQSEATLDFYQHDRSPLNPIRNSMRTRRETKKLAGLRKNAQEFRDEIEKPLRAKEAELELKKAHKEQLAKEQCSQMGAQIEFLKTLSGSQELAYALAEREMLDYLQRLPDHFHVINHVNLQVDRGFRLQGKWLIRGEIDHLVVGPAGLFAIQVKNWSKQHNKKAQRTNLGEQINNAAQLCYLMIKPDYPDVTVRSILAYRGHLPESENTGFVKVLPLQEVGAYISWFTENSLDNNRLQQLVTYLNQLSGQKFAE